MLDQPLRREKVRKFRDEANSWSQRGSAFGGTSSRRVGGAVDSRVSLLGFAGGRSSTDAILNRNDWRDQDGNFLPWYQREFVVFSRSRPLPLPERLARLGSPRGGTARFARRATPAAREADRSTVSRTRLARDAKGQPSNRRRALSRSNSRPSSTAAVSLRRRGRTNSSASTSASTTRYMSNFGKTNSSL